MCHSSCSKRITITTSSSTDHSHKSSNYSMVVSQTSPGQAGLPSPNPSKSFWHSEPSKILLGHKTTDSLPSEADVVIIGSGISGAFAAHYLQQDERGKNLKVVMLEAREACWGATGRVCLLPQLVTPGE